MAEAALVEIATVILPATTTMVGFLAFNQVLKKTPCIMNWHACAGPLVTVPREGEKVFYFPQEHIELCFYFGDDGFFCFYFLGLLNLCFLVFLFMELACSVQSFCVFFGHVEASTNQVADKQKYDLPSKILCRVINVLLKAEPDTDEVFAQVTLLPEQNLAITWRRVVKSLGLWESVREFARLYDSGYGSHSSQPSSHAFSSIKLSAGG